MAASQDLNRRVEAEGLTLVEWKLLRLLCDETASPPSALAAKMSLNSGTVTKIADKLLKKGLIERIDDPRDRRGHPLSLTSAGRAKLPRLAALAQANDEASFGALSREDRESLDRILKVLVQQRNGDAERSGRGRSDSLGSVVSCSDPCIGRTRMPTYQGQCHCGDTRFEIEAEIDHVRECDCSVCRRRGALIFRVASDAIRFLTPLDRLATYRWGTGTATDYICSKCGVMPFRQPSAPTNEEVDAGMARFEGWAVNVRCIDILDLDVLPRIRIAGSELEI